MWLSGGRRERQAGLDKVTSNRGQSKARAFRDYSSKCEEEQGKVYTRTGGDIAFIHWCSKAYSMLDYNSVRCRKVGEEQILIKALSVQLVSLGAFFSLGNF